MIKTEKPNIIIYRDTLLAPSDTFIRAQGEGLSHYVPYYFGLTRVPGLELPAERIFRLSNGSAFGRIQEVLFKTTGYSCEMRKQLLSINPCLVHAHFGFDGTTILPLVDRLQFPLLVTYHGLDATLRPEFLRKLRWGKRYLRRQKLLKQRCNGFIAVSQFIRSKLIEQAFPEDRIAVHYIGIDTQAFTPIPTVRREPLVLFVGRLVEKKGCEFSIRAMQFVQKEMPGAKLVIVGDGPLRSSLESQAAATLRQVTFTGLQTSEQIRGWMNRATVQCVPSVTAASGDSEGLPIVVLEAMALGTPVSASYSAGIPEAVTNGETGLLAPERDWRALAANIINLLTNRAMWESMSRASQQRVRRDFDLRKQCTKLEQMYSEIVSRDSMKNDE